MKKTILITGGSGYIGSHAALAFLQAGYEVVVLDNLCNSSADTMGRVAKIAGRAPMFVKGDVRDASLLNEIFKEHHIDAVIHFAGLKAIGESVREPLRYYDNNLAGTLILCKAMADAGIFTLVFSSSATVYGDPETVPICEDHPVGNVTNPYGRSKFIAEQILTDLATSDGRWRVALLRYFNPVGAHESGLIGEEPRGIPTNLLPYIAQVAAGKLAEVSVFGNDYPTQDGTGVRDYIHVVDLAQGHLYALNALQTKLGIHIWNLGTGKGYSVLEILSAFMEETGQYVPYQIMPRRPGDIAICFADPSRAERDLCWKAQRGLPEMMRDVWRWQSTHQS